MPGSQPDKTHVYKGGLRGGLTQDLADKRIDPVALKRHPYSHAPTDQERRHVARHESHELHPPHHKGGVLSSQSCDDKSNGDPQRHPQQPRLMIERGDRRCTGGGRDAQKGTEGEVQPEERRDLRSCQLLLLHGRHRKPEIGEYLKKGRKGKEHAQEAEVFGRQESGKYRENAQTQGPVKNRRGKHDDPATGGPTAQILRTATPQDVIASQGSRSYSSSTPVGTRTRASAV